MTNGKKDYLTAIESGIENVPVRVFDRYLLGPFLVWYGLKSKKMAPLPRKLIISAGIWQVFYNWRNYREIPGHISNLSEFPKLLNLHGKINT